MPEDRKALSVWLRFVGDDEESEAEANIYVDEPGFVVDWSLSSVGQITSVYFPTYSGAVRWLEFEGFQDFTA